MPGNVLGKNRRGRTEARKKPGKLQSGPPGIAELSNDL